MDLLSHHPDDSFHGSTFPLIESEKIGVACHRIQRYLRVLVWMNRDYAVLKKPDLNERSVIGENSAIALHFRLDKSAFQQVAMFK